MPTAPTLIPLGTDIVIDEIGGITISGATGADSDVNGFYDSDNADPPVFTQTADSNYTIVKSGTTWEIRVSPSTDSTFFWDEAAHGNPIGKNWQLGTEAVTSPITVKSQSNPVAPQTITV